MTQDYDMYDLVPTAGTDEVRRELERLRRLAKADTIAPNVRETHLVRKVEVLAGKIGMHPKRLRNYVDGCCRDWNAELFASSWTSAPYVLGGFYETFEGTLVEIVDVSNEDGLSKPARGYECVRGDDGIWRYNRRSDRGRVTGTATDHVTGLYDDLRSLKLPFRTFTS